MAKWLCLLISLPLSIIQSSHCCVQYGFEPCMGHVRQNKHDGRKRISSRQDSCFAVIFEFCCIIIK